ncbi:MAG: FctA domain-containing protein, partial [Bacillota bacterium]|nr:FctA domain-containing protein [Bacillota bacterium]
KGAKLTDGHFTFCLTDHEGTEHEAVNSADGTVQFPPFTFTEPGTYTFSLIERTGTKPGMVYDRTQYDLTLTLVISSANKLVASEEAWTKNGEAYDEGVPVFKNTQKVPTYPAIQVPIEARKVLKNGALKAGEFAFVLKDRRGKVLARATNGKDGLVSFPARSFSREVTNFIYTIHEVEGKNSHITYDKTVYTVKVTTRATKGQLSAAVAIEKDGVPFSGDMVFTNIKKAPPTGDNTFLIICVIAGLGLLAGGAALLISKRRKNKKT